jgi:hypothetical protein
MNGLGWASLDTGQSLVPAPPDSMTGVSMLKSPEENFLHLKGTSKNPYFVIPAQAGIPPPHRGMGIKEVRLSLFLGNDGLLDMPSSLFYFKLLQALIGYFNRKAPTFRRNLNFWT